MMGAVWGYFVGSIYPNTAFDPNFDVAIALMAFLGGLGTLAGPILGALLLEPTQQYFALQYGQSGYYLVIYGALFLVVILLLPQGLLPTIQARWATYRATRNQEEREDEAVVTALPDQGGSAGIEKKEGINL
jgi:branched-chain amino acid transport system permease protein